jgi:hypothetical protein
MQNPLVIGDRVQYKAEFLRSIGQYTGPMPFARGKILSLAKLGTDTTLATIFWDLEWHDRVPSKVNVANLERAKQ